MDSMAAPCRCWIQVDQIPFADLKGYFAASDLSLSLPGPAMNDG